MAELSLKQIEERLNSEFTGQSRKIVFWYDAKQEFIEDIKNLKLENAKIHYLTETNSFETKVLLERRDKKSNYLIYAPFAKPKSEFNHLADTLKYSKEFVADRISLMMNDLGIDTKYRAVLERHSSFFDAKVRRNRFYRLEAEYNNEDHIEIALLSAAVRSKVAGFEEVVRILITQEDLNDSEHFKELQKYDLEEVFWKHCHKTFSFVNETPSLEKLVISLFITYAEREIDGKLPSSLNRYILNKAGTVMAFMDQLKNNLAYWEAFDSLSQMVYRKINGHKVFKGFNVEELINLDLFDFVDKKIIEWVVNRLLDENINARIKDMDIPSLCEFRELKHFGSKYSNEYRVLKYGFFIISCANYRPESNIVSIIDRYHKEVYKIDTYYRKFYYYLDRILDDHIFDELRVLVENIYTNRYLDVITKEFNNTFSYEAISGKYKLQRDFYKNYLAHAKNRVIVIISDAFRYEVAKELVKELEKDKKVNSVNIEPQIGILPSFTGMGMAALLPHEKLEADEIGNGLVDGKSTSSLKARDSIIKSYNPNSAAISYDALQKYSREEMEDFFVGKSIIYIYHNKIDDRGESGDEDQVFTACIEAIEEIHGLIRKLTDRISATRYIITADHGFIYKRDRIKESAKIENVFSRDDVVNKRYVLSDYEYSVIGTKTIEMSKVLGNSHKGFITFPLTSNIFKVPGGGQNYIHGGSSPQELLVPVVEVRTNRGRVESRDVGISLISMLTRITSLIITLDFIQTEAISDVVRPAKYRIAFVDESGEIISNEEIHLANSTQQESAKRVFSLTFNLKNQKYARDKTYYLVIENWDTGVQVLRHEVIIDIAFADDFGFDI